MDYNSINIEQSYPSDFEDNIKEEDYLNNIENENYNFTDAEENTTSSNVRKNTRIWINHECTKRLMEIYSEYNPNIGKSGPFITKKEMFEYIAKKLYEEFGEKYTGIQVASRIKNIFRRKGFKKQMKADKKSESLNQLDISKFNLESMYDDEDDYITENDDDENDANFSRMGFTCQQSKKLIRLYNMFLPNVGSNQQFKTKKDIWEAISDEIEYEFNVKFTPEQCCTRYLTIVRKAKRLLLRTKKNSTNKVNLSKFYKDQRTKESRSISEDESNPHYQNTEDNTEDDEYENPLNYQKRYDSKNRKCDKSNTNFLENKLNKFCDKDTMRTYLEYKAKKAKLEEQRHREIMEQLNKINNTLLEIKNRDAFI